MLVYMCLVVVALLAPAADSAICVFPDQYEITQKQYLQNNYINMSIDNTRQLVAATMYSLDTNGQPTVTGWIVKDYKRLIQTFIPVNGPCKSSELKEEIVTEIPDDAIKVEVPLPLPLPPDLMKATEYWRFKSTDNEEIVGVLPISSNACFPVVWGNYYDNEIMRDSVSYLSGHSSLSIQDRRVFEVGSKCTQE